MERRSLLQLACAIMPISVLATRAEAATPDQAKVAYHLSDLDKVDFVLGNIRNHYNGMGGPDKVTIALVVHLPAQVLGPGEVADPDAGQPAAPANRVPRAASSRRIRGRTAPSARRSLRPGRAAFLDPERHQDQQAGARPFGRIGVEGHVEALGARVVDQLEHRSGPPGKVARW